VRVNHEAYLNGCLNRHDDFRNIGEMTKPEVREAFRETVANQVPFYGEYMIQKDNGEWHFNNEYINT
jgi:cyclic pyranopterin phosphate synthase